MTIYEGNDVDHPQLGSCRYLGFAGDVFVWFVYSAPSAPGHDDVNGAFHYTNSLPDGWVDPEF